MFLYKGICQKNCISLIPLDNFSIFDYGFHIILFIIFLMMISIFSDIESTSIFIYFSCKKDSNSLWLLGFLKSDCYLGASISMFCESFWIRPSTTWYYKHTWEFKDHRKGWSFGLQDSNQKKPSQIFSCHMNIHRYKATTLTVETML